MKFYTSDLHFSHRNIIEYEKRPFPTTEEMDEYLIYKWNDKVGRKDEVFILGDFAFCNGRIANYLLDRLKGKKHLIIGNHDKYFLKDRDFDPSKFESISKYDTTHDNKRKICMFHYPIAVWDGQNYGSLHFYGHVHSNGETHHPLLLDLGENAFNVGCDVHNYEPVTLDELLKGR